MRKKTWKHYTIVQKPPVGLVHIILKDDTEKVVDAGDISWKASAGDITCYMPVSEEYQQEFNNGKHRAVDDEYLLTSKRLKKNR